MIVGDPSRFAIESGLSQAYARLSLRGLGFFVLHLGGVRYGVFAPDATALACSVDEVEERIDRRGTHTAPFAEAAAADEIAKAFVDAIYNTDETRSDFLGLSKDEFCEWVYSSNLVWAPDGDEAFDDGSHVLQFDVGDRVRLIACKWGNDYLPVNLADVWLDADQFYDLMKSWHLRFEAEWLSMPKVSDGNGQSIPN